MDYFFALKEYQNGNVEGSLKIHMGLVKKGGQFSTLSFLKIVYIFQRKQSKDYSVLESALSSFLKSDIFKHRPAEDFSKSIYIARKHIMLLKLPTLEKFRRLKSVLLEKKPKKNKIMFLTCVWGRHELTELFVDYYSYLKDSFKEELEIDMIVVGSEGQLTSAPVINKGFKYIEFENECLTDKWQAGVDYSSEFEFDGLVIIGSDDFICDKAIRQYEYNIRNNILASGFTNLQIYDVHSDNLGIWNGYGTQSGAKSQPTRFGESIGLGRYIDRRVLEVLDFDLWNGVKRNKGLDKAMQERMQRALCFYPVEEAYLVKEGVESESYNFGIMVNPAPGLALDVKLDDNVTSFDAFLSLGDSFSLLPKKDFFNRVLNDVNLKSKINKIRINFEKSIFANDLSSKVQSFVPRGQDILICIPTYNRQKNLHSLIQQLDRFADGFDVSIALFDDGSDIPVSVDFDLKNIKNVYIKRTHNYGKKKYWLRVNEIFEYMTDFNAELYFYLPDDVSLTDDFIRKSLVVWQSISDAKKLGLNLLEDGRTKCWTNYERHLIDFDICVYKTQWLDMAILFGRELLKYRLEPIPVSFWDDNPYKSSGVGSQLSRRIHKDGFNLYQTPISFIHHGPHDSVMNPEERVINPLLSSKGPYDRLDDLKSYYNDKKLVICGVASIYSRLQSLSVTIQSIIDQVDILVVYQNDYKMTDGIFSSNKIVVFSALDTADDRGDAGKFFTIDFWESGYYFSIDDDLNYPQDYVSSTLSKLTSSSRSILSYHGRSMVNGATDYYRDLRENYRCLDEVEGDHYVDFGGTGVMAFEIGTVNFCFRDFRAPNMADIWVGKFCAEQNVKIKVLSHTNDWIKHNDIDFSDTIFRRYKKNHDFQNLVMNEALELNVANK